MWKNDIMIVFIILFTILEDLELNKTAPAGCATGLQASSECGKESLSKYLYNISIIRSTYFILASSSIAHLVVDRNGNDELDPHEDVDAPSSDAYFIDSSIHEEFTTYL